MKAHVEATLLIEDSYEGIAIGFCWPSLFKDAHTMCGALTSWDLFLCPLAIPTSWWEWIMFLNRLKRSRANAMIIELFSNFSKRTSSLDLEYPRP
ncbi:hypothetical protein AAG906_008144 [Vitis piasezkii]